MKLIRTLIFGCVILLSENCVSRGEKFVVNTFKSITNVPLHKGRIPYIEKHPAANTDHFPQEKRMKLCRDGLVHVQKEKRKNFALLKNEGTENLQVYVVVTFTPTELGFNVVQILQAYQCPTSPPTYIHVRVEDKDDEPVFVVFLKDSDSIPTFKEVTNYQVKLAHEITEANVEEISKTLDGDADVVIPSLYDTEELSEDQRLQMCRRGIQTVPEMNFQISEDASSGLSKYYAVITRSQRKTDDPTKNLTFMQAFECPTEPKIYIHVNYGRGKAHTLLTIVKEDATELRPAFDIMGYEILPVVSIDVYEGSQGVESIEKEKQIQEIKEEMKTIMSDNSRLRDETIEKFQRLHKTLHELQMEIGVRKIIPSGKVDSDKLTENERREICGRALEAVSGQSVEYTVDTVGPNQRYAVKLENEWLHKEITVVLEAFKCPTKPVVYIHITDRESVENTVRVIVTGSTDFETLTTRFKK